MENLGFAKSKDISFVVSGGKRKVDPGARRFVHMGQEDILLCGSRR